MKAQTKTHCIDCKTELEIWETVEVGEIIECKNCGAEMEILSLNPIKFEVLEEEK